MNQAIHKFAIANAYTGQFVAAFSDVQQRCRVFHNADSALKFDTGNDARAYAEREFTRHYQAAGLRVVYI